MIAPVPGGLQVQCPGRGAGPAAATGPRIKRAARGGSPCRIPGGRFGQRVIDFQREIEDWVRLALRSKVRADGRAQSGAGTS